MAMIPTEVPKEMTSAKGNKKEKCGAGSAEVRSHLSHETSNADISPVLLMRHFAFSLCRTRNVGTRIAIVDYRSQGAFYLMN